jgi:3-hydroxybutyryl-CoA dehydrogenase
MVIAVMADEFLKNELTAQGLNEKVRVEWLDKPAFIKNALCYIDLLFTPRPERIQVLQQLQPALVIVNDLTGTLKSLPNGFVRINGWPTFLKRQITEASCLDAANKQPAAEIFSAFGKTIEWVPDVPGFISARIICTIINEAYFTLQENVSTKAEIDIAMKLGTNYPYGPFEWSEKIGLKKIVELLNVLALTNSRYKPCDLLITEALSK